MPPPRPGRCQAVRDSRSRPPVLRSSPAAARRRGDRAAIPWAPAGCHQWSADWSRYERYPDGTGARSRLRRSLAPMRAASGRDAVEDQGEEDGAPLRPDLDGTVERRQGTIEAAGVVGVQREQRPPRDDLVARFGVADHAGRRGHRVLLACPPGAEPPRRHPDAVRVKPGQYAGLRGDNVVGLGRRRQRRGRTVSATTSSGPPPASTSTASATSTALPTARPSGRSMAVSSATVRRPWSAPMPTIVVARSRASSAVFMNAPEPTLTSSTSAPVPSAIFFDMIELAMSGIDSTVLVTSRGAYSLRSAGASPLPAAQTTTPVARSTSSISAVDRDARQPGIDSSLSKVPPVCPSPRPDSCGTAAPHAATVGARGNVILSPTPPVECLSVVGRSSADQSMRSPVRIIASVQAATSRRVIPLSRTAIASAAICSSATTPLV